MRKLRTTYAPHLRGMRRRWSADGAERASTLFERGHEPALATVRAGLVASPSTRSALAVLHAAGAVLGAPKLARLVARVGATVADPSAVALCAMAQDAKGASPIATATRLVARMATLRDGHVTRDAGAWRATSRDAVARDRAALLRADARDAARSRDERRLVDTGAAWNRAADMLAALRAAEDGARARAASASAASAWRRWRVTPHASVAMLQLALRRLADARIARREARARREEARAREAARMAAARAVAGQRTGDRPAGVSRREWNHRCAAHRREHGAIAAPLVPVREARAPGRRKVVGR